MAGNYVSGKKIVRRVGIVEQGVFEMICTGKLKYIKVGSPFPKQDSQSYHNVCFVLRVKVYYQNSFVIT